MCTPWICYLLILAWCKYQPVWLNNVWIQVLTSSCTVRCIYCTLRMQCTCCQKPSMLLIDANPNPNPRWINRKGIYLLASSVLQKIPQHSIYFNTNTNQGYSFVQVAIKRKLNVHLQIQKYINDTVEPTVIEVYNCFLLDRIHLMKWYATHWIS